MSANEDLPKPAGQPNARLHDAILEWEAAVAAVAQDSQRVAAGGAPDAGRLAELQAGVEIARKRCARLADALDQPGSSAYGDLN